MHNSYTVNTNNIPIGLSESENNAITIVETVIFMVTYIDNSCLCVGLFNVSVH